MAAWLAARLEALQALFMRRGYRGPTAPQKRRQRGSGGPLQALSAGLGSRFGRYRHLHPSPRAKRGQRAGVRRGWFLRYAQSETKQKSRPKKEPPQRKGWKKKGSKVEVPLRKKQTGKASPTPKRRRGCAAHAGESWRFLGGTRFSLCGRVELLRRMGRVTTANG